MILVLIYPDPRDSYTPREFREFPDGKLTEALLYAEETYKVEPTRPISVYQGGMICKSRWGPEDPGGVFNSVPTPPTYDKGERD